MPTILCFGDSNTWGFDPLATSTSPFPIRHAAHLRWTGILARELGPDWRVIEEGQNGRATVFEDHLAPASRNGRAYLPSCLESHQPIDIVAIMLGTNDLKTMFALPPQDIANGVGALIRIVRQSATGPQAKPPQVLVICPPALDDLSHLPDLDARFANGRARSLRFPELYEAIAKQYGVPFLNAQPLIPPGKLDGLHLDEKDHAALGSAVAEKALTMMN